MKLRSGYYLIIFILFLKFQLVEGQNIADGIAYQTIVRSISGAAITNQTVAIKFSIYSGSASGSLVWEETFTKATDQNGLLRVTIGNGVSTGGGLYASFSIIDWSDNAYYLKVALDVAGGANYEDIGTAQLLSVPYAFYSLQTDKLSNYFLDQLMDVNAAGPIAGNIIKWNGSFWIAGSDNYSDTVSFAYSTFYSSNSDTAYYSYSQTVSDSILFAYYSDTSQFSNSSFNSLGTNNTLFSDTALFALASPPSGWLINGNSNTAGANYPGSSDSQDVVFKTNSAEVLRIVSDGNITSSGAPNLSSFTVLANDGFLSPGTFGAGTLSTVGSGNRLLWYPGKSSFRAGGITSNQWDDINIGNYSFAAGYNCIAGDFSFAAGNTSTASGSYAIAMGRKAQATALGIYPSGVSVALGDSSVASTPRSFVMGKGNVASTNNAAIAIGFNCKSSGATATALGTSSVASGNYSIALGYFGSSNMKTGSFVYADASSPLVTNSTVNNQFLVRASGGVIFYTDPLNTMGVILPAGGGSWASVSDKNKKENFKLINADSILHKIEKLKISSWSYISQPSVRHIGPIAQDFYKIFNVGDNNKTISMVDIDGISMLGIKSLYKKISLLSPLLEVEELSRKADSLNFKDLDSRLTELEEKFNKKH